MTGYNTYQNNQNCIWRIQPPVGYSVKLHIVLLDLERNKSNNYCYDILRVHETSSNGRELYKGCYTNKRINISSNTENMWIQLFTDTHINNGGFKAEYSFHLLAQDSRNSMCHLVKPGLPLACPTLPTVFIIWHFVVLEFCDISIKLKCRNHECIPWAYICNGINDCGCVGKQCDEYNCQNKSLMLNSKLSIGIICGILLFVGVIVIILFMNYKEKRRLINEESERQKKLKTNLYKRPKLNLFNAENENKDNSNKSASSPDPSNTPANKTSIIRSESIITKVRRISNTIFNVPNNLKNTKIKPINKINNEITKRPSITITAPFKTINSTK
ncbi:hypothetical protein A3Q56_06111 [Intoshia linei]|uniref:CUB domain-containing protein n=1 Tax=Intoshia linei TaxID=1819745 RepID=A0A177AWF3_9BILA|nr:hypothetical protein A3Q56_06111 [Intoshia linei]